MKYNKYLKYLRYLTIAYTATLCVLFPYLMVRKSTVSNVDITLGIVVEVTMIVLFFALVFVTFFQKEEEQPKAEPIPTKYVMSDNSTPKNWTEVAYLKVSTIYPTPPPELSPAPTKESFNDASNRWAEIVRQEADTSESYDEFKEQFLKKTSLSLCAFVNNELTKVKATNEGCVWKYCNFRLTLSTTTNVYFLEEYI
jgi:hypothetical protein